MSEMSIPIEILVASMICWALVESIVMASSSPRLLTVSGYSEGTWEVARKKVYSYLIAPVLSNVGAALDLRDELGKEVIVIDDLDKFGEMVRVPLSVIEV